MFQLLHTWSHVQKCKEMFNKTSNLPQVSILPAPASDHSNPEPANIWQRDIEYILTRKQIIGRESVCKHGEERSLLAPALFLSGLTEDQTNAALDRDPLGNPEIIHSNENKMHQVTSFKTFSQT